jgi:hypothetical protein
MAYKYTKGSVRRGDIYNEDDTQGNTYLDWSEDAAGFVVGGELVLAVSASVVSVAVPLAVDGNVSSSGIIYATDLYLNTNDDSTQTTIYVQGENGTEFYSLGTGGFNLTSGGEIRLLAGSGAALHLGTNAADSKVVVTSGGDVGIGDTSPDYTLDVAGDIGINDYIYHNEDANTYIGFPSVNKVNLVANGHSFLKYDGDILINNANRDRDTKIMADDGNVMLHVDAGDNRVGIHTTSPGSTFEVSGSQAGNYTQTAASITFTETHYVVDYTGNGNATFTLPASSGVTGRQYHIISHNQAELGVLTITGSGGDFQGAHLDGDAATVEIEGWTPQSLSLISTGTNWFILHDGRTQEE